jgi:hypothetical protein
MARATRSSAAPRRRSGSTEVAIIASSVMSDHGSFADALMARERLRATSLIG